MKNKNAIVIGAQGQDGSFMCDILINNNYNVFGVIKENSESKNINKDVNYLEINFSKTKAIDNLIKDLKPVQIYNFMGVTNVFDPWSDPEITYENNFIVPLKIIDSLKQNSPSTKFLQSSSCLVFGNNSITPQDESTIRNPIYHYGISKNFTDEIIKLYRDKFNLFVCSAIFYNHESERRGENFFTKKLIRDAFDVKFGKKEFIELGNLDSYRDIGYAKDYVEACYLILNYNKPDDYIISSGNLTKISKIVEYVFEKLEISIEKSLRINDELKRQETLSHLVGRNEKIKKIGWSGTKSVEEIIDIMINHEKKKYENLINK